MMADDELRIRIVSQHRPDMEGGNVYFMNVDGKIHPVIVGPDCVCHAGFAKHTITIKDGLMTVDPSLVLDCKHGHFHFWIRDNKVVRC